VECGKVRRIRISRDATDYRAALFSRNFFASSAYFLWSCYSSIGMADVKLVPPPSVGGDRSLVATAPFSTVEGATKALGVAGGETDSVIASDSEEGSEETPESKALAQGLSQPTTSLFYHSPRSSP
jgi:hypothetical protein